MLKEIVRFFRAVVEAKRQHDEFQRLSALSDVELARRGLRRADVGAHVFGVLVNRAALARRLAAVAQDTAPARRAAA